MNRTNRSYRGPSDRPIGCGGNSNLISRSTFLSRVGLAFFGTLAASAAPAGATENDAVTRPTSRPGARPFTGKGRADSPVKGWDVVTIGNLSRNRYWGEPDVKGLRPAICTCTLVTGDGFRLLVDPSLADAEQMARELDRRSGQKPRDITAAFVTHEHGDHWAGLSHFTEARWFAGPPIAEILNKSGKLPRKVEAVTGRLLGAIDVVPTPGHTNGHHSLRFDCDGLSVVTAGDAVATRDFFRERRGYYNAVDFERSARTMDELAAMADIIVPGHDNYFLVG